jgi:hypothetical protein
MLYALAAIGYVLWSHPAITAWPPLARLFVGILALSAPFLFWALARLIFEAGHHWPSGLPAALRTGFRLIALALIFHVFWLVWKGRSGDLVEKRLRLRTVFLVGAGLMTAFLVLIALLYAPAPDWPVPARLSQAGVLLLFNFGYAVWLMHVDRDFFPPAAGPGPLRLTLNSGAAGSEAEAESDSRLDSKFGLKVRAEARPGCRLADTRGKPDAASGSMAGDRLDHRRSRQPCFDPGISSAPPYQSANGLPQFHRLPQ